MKFKNTIRKIILFISIIKSKSKQIRWLKKFCYALYLIVALLIVPNLYLFFFSPHEGHIDIVTDNLTYFSTNAFYIRANVIADNGIYFRSNGSMKFLVIANYYELYSPTGELCYAGSCPSEYKFGFPIKLEQGTIILKNLDDNSALCGNLVVESDNIHFQQDFSDSIFSTTRYLICESKSKSFYCLDMFPPEGESYLHDWIIDLDPTKVSYQNGQQVSPPYDKIIVKEVVGIIVYNCDTITIPYHEYDPAEIWNFYNLYDCNIVARGVLNFSLADTITEYNLTGQNLFIDLNEKITTVATGIECSGIKGELSNDGKKVYLWVNGPVDTAELSGYTLFHTLSGLLRKNTWGVIAILITPFVIEFFNLFIKKN